MPLKHFTETFLVVVLGAVIALTGLLTATLPNLPDGALPWAVLFILSVVYPLSLYSLFQRRRADNTFRNLHWFPAGMLLVWLMLQGAVLGSTVEVENIAMYSWGWTLAPVLLGFVLLVLFCLKVIRRRLPRLVFLGLILIPFAAAAFLSEQEGQWEQELASVMWSGDFWKVDETGFLASFIDEEGKNLEESDDEMEEDWRERLRMQERREERIANRTDEDTDDDMKEVVLHVDMDSSSSSGHEYNSVSSRPSELPESGFGWSAIILMLVAGYCAALNESARRRV
ncbi:MAG: hypothetical protein HOG89_00050 [Candidatus Peribacter sp.]|jgi:hypothetical protein|nr:hypothetical protein [Candidatus Peribacter sp.]MBT4392773.1 hypothetical protein [Candidatus Peribacter sp.]MBT4600610.1 hypothetical protein [Candidatus Peribacter sp.]MBT5148721.1 hypothetical protein [Candidatus Peribacter sp.]MBT5637684.1 hypothetical protein [Candidatus Peribacter sp.]